MDWFEKITGFRERNYAETRARLEVADGRLRSLVNGRSYAVGELDLMPLQRLRELGRVAAVGFATARPGGMKVSIVEGGVREMHQAPENSGALFQVASQFNLLEMPSPSVTPEHGVTAYQHDKTQGPACAMAAGAATIYRNYFAPVGDQQGQTSAIQIDALAPIGEALGISLARPASDLWSMCNGYAICTGAGLDAISAHLAAQTPAEKDALREKLCIGVQTNVEVTDGAHAPPAHVSQAFCSALPVAYGSVPAKHWKAFATLILEASYEATMWAALLNAQRTGSNVVLLTRVGGGVFGNDAKWIDDAMRRALALFRHLGLDVRLVSYRSPSADQLRLIRDFS